jgi:CHAT domain-containing protein
VPTPTVERQLLADLSKVYSGYFEFLCDQGKTADAFRVIERARGRVEAQSLAHHEVVTPHELNPVEQRLTKLNIDLLNTDDSAARAHILDSIYETELQLDTDSTAKDKAPEPVDLRQLQRELRPSELLLEYVLDNPHSYALALTATTVRRYTLASKDKLEQAATQYRSEIVKQKMDPLLAQQLFNGLLGGIPEFKEKQALIVVPDGKLHLLPFAALADNGQYILASHLVSVVPSGTVLHMLEHRAQQTEEANLPYVGVAAWTTDSPPHTLLASIHRAVSGPERSELVALPESRHEVEAIAADLPNFKQLPLGQFSVIHLALHGYVDPEIPDRSALVFAPQQQPTDDGLLQIREIRNLHLNASLVTLSACNTGVGPVGEEGVASIVNAFIEAGSQSVVSTLWELEDHATAHLMTVFYGHLGQREEKAVALRQAQLEMLNSGLPPYYWAGFVLAGNPRGSLFPAPTVNLTARSSR